MRQPGPLGGSLRDELMFAALIVRGIVLRIYFTLLWLCCRTPLLMVYANATRGI